MVVGVGSEVPAQSAAARFRQKHDIRGPFAIYVGRIDENKGCKELFEFFSAYLREAAGRLTLVLIGHSLLEIPKHPRIRHLGFVDDTDKFDAIAGSELLIMPSYFESLSMVALEAWALGRPVLANAKCDVLKGQCIRSNAGLYYDSRSEFVESLRAIEHNRWMAGSLGRNGRQYYRDHYDWPVIERKYLDMLDRLSKASADRDTIEPCPGWFERRKATVQPASEVVAAVPVGAVDHSGSLSAATTGAGIAAAAAAPERLSGRVRFSAIARHHGRRRSGGRSAPGWVADERHVTPAVHQVLATLGYGDAIGHEVLGIQRVLRAAGYESDIFVETVDPRLESLTRDYRELVDASRARQPSAPSFLDRIEGVAHRLRPARSDGAHLPQHHAAGILRRRASHARASMLPRPARDSRLRRSLRPRARRLRIQPPGSRVARISTHRRAAGGARPGASRRSGRLVRRAVSSTTTGPTSCLSDASSATRRSKI